MGHESAGGRIHVASGHEILEACDAESRIAAHIDAPERLEIGRDIERKPVRTGKPGPLFERIYAAFVSYVRELAGTPAL